MDPGSVVPLRNQLTSASRYELLLKIATGGTATIYVGRIIATEGFQRLVAIKRAHPHLRDDPTSRRMLVREATLASGIHHANVVSILDIEESDDELLLVMSYVEGGSLADLLDAALDRGSALPGRIALRVVMDACAGLGAVHALTDEAGRPLGFAHRDVSPQNILVGLDGTSRLTDFGLAKLTEVSMSRTASLKGKIAYMAPEYVQGAPYSQQCDIFSMGVVLWEALTSQRLFRGRNEADTIRRLTTEPAPRVSTVRPERALLDPIVERALQKDTAHRYKTMADFAEALAQVAAAHQLSAHRSEVSRVVEELLGDALRERREVIRACMVDPADPDAGVTASLVDAELPWRSAAESGPPRPSVARHRSASQPSVRSASGPPLGYPRGSSERDTQTAPAVELPSEPPPRYPRSLSESDTQTVPLVVRPSEPPPRYPRSSSTRDTQTAPAAPQALAERHEASVDRAVGPSEPPAHEEAQVESPPQRGSVPAVALAQRSEPVLRDSSPAAAFRADLAEPLVEAPPRQPAPSASAARLRGNVIMLVVLIAALIVVLWTVLGPRDGGDGAATVTPIVDRFSTELIDRLRRAAARTPLTAEPSASATSSVEPAPGAGGGVAAGEAGAGPAGTPAVPPPHRPPGPKPPEPRPPPPHPSVQPSIPQNPYKPRFDRP